MMSSQTMTAPALNHRPPDTAPGSSMYAYAAASSHQADSKILASSPSDDDDDDDDDDDEFYEKGIDVVDDSAIRGALLYGSVPDQSEHVGTVDGDKFNPNCNYGDNGNRNDKNRLSFSSLSDGDDDGGEDSIKIKTEPGDDDDDDDDNDNDVDVDDAPPAPAPSTALPPTSPPNEDRQFDGKQDEDGQIAASTLYSQLFGAQQHDLITSATATSTTNPPSANPSQQIPPEKSPGAAAEVEEEKHNEENRDNDPNEKSNGAVEDGSRSPSIKVEDAGPLESDADPLQIPLSSENLQGFSQNQERNVEEGKQQEEREREQRDDGLQHTNQDDHANLFKTTDPTTGLPDPLPSLEQPPDFFPFDITAPPSDSLEALKQNEILTAAYLSSQSADLAALGYPQGLQDGAPSVDGSEPRIQAFAKLEFDDGHFYVNTYSFILGRDVRAARAARQRELRTKQALRHGSSGGNAPYTPNRVRPDGSAIMGSVVSDRGGIMGFDPEGPPHFSLSRRSSNSSFEGSGAPLHATPAQLHTTDYNALALQSLNEEDGGDLGELGDTGDAKPVDTSALLPSPDACPTIPIHPPATSEGVAAGHKGISRKHVKIAYSFDKSLFEMEVVGRNGAFIGSDFLQPGQVRPLHSGDYIQIGGVRIRFLLPDVPIGETGADRPEEEEADEEADGLFNVDDDEENDVQEDDEEREAEDTSPKVTKLVLKTKDPDPDKPRPSVEENGEQPARRRGPGRPPKDGIMSKRERAELAREQKLAARREANGGVTPPPPPTPSSKPKLAKPIPEGESPASKAEKAEKAEKRKYNKRKRPEEMSMDTPVPTTEVGAPSFSPMFAPPPPPPSSQPDDFARIPPLKKRKPSRSPSPNYPPESAYSPEDLAKPPYNYAVLIFDALSDVGAPMTLKQIYRALKLKYPYFRFKCETEGWTSSVRHNLNGNGHLFMHAERDGKGWSWQLRPGASVEKEKKRRPSPPPSQPPSATGASSMPPMVDHSYGNPPPMIDYSYSNPPPMVDHTYGNPPPPPPPASMGGQQFQFSSAPLDPYIAPQQAQPPSNPYPPPTNPHPSLPSHLQNSLPPAFIQPPTTYISPYASDPPPQLVQYHQSQQFQVMPHHQNPPPPPQAHPHPPFSHQQHTFSIYTPPQQQQQQQQPHHLSPHNQGAMFHQPQHLPHPPPPMGQAPPPAPPVENTESSFHDRANKAIDDFEAVLMEDYDDKNYIREVLRSARARALGLVSGSSFPGGEPKDEAVIFDALSNLVGSLKDE